jgi:hypothetical protein
MRKILKYFFSISVLCFLFSASYSQSERIKGLRIGVDLSRFSLYFIDPGRTGFQVSADFEVIDNLYATVEYGQQKVSFTEKDTIDRIKYNYNSDGSYYRIGVDYNFLKYKMQNQYDMLFLGLRFGSSEMTHSADNITIFSPYWGNYTEGSVPEKHLNAYWTELVAGVRAELFKNFFMGWSVSGRLMLKQDKDDTIDPYNIPGFGNGSKKSGFGFNYSIYYKIPIFKEKIKVPTTKANK